MFAIEIANSMPQSESILLLLMQYGRQSTRRSFTSFEPPPCSSQDPLLSPGPAATPPSYSLNLSFSFHSSISSPLCISVSLFPLSTLLSLSLPLFPFLLPILQQLLKPYFYLSIGGWSGAAPMPAALHCVTDSQLTGESEIEQERERK